MIWRQIPLMVERYWISVCFEIFEIWEREGNPLVSGRVLLQHAISSGLVPIASMVSTLVSFKGSTIHNLSWNYAKCQPLVSQTWRKPLAMLGPRSSSGDCCALLFYLFVLSMSSKSETNKGLDFVHLLVNGMIYVYIWEHLETSILVELVQSPPGKCHHNMCYLRDHARYMKLCPKGSWVLGTCLWMFVAASV